MTVEGTGKPERPVKVAAVEGPAAGEANAKPAGAPASDKPAPNPATLAKRQERRQAEKRELRMRTLVAQQLASMPAADPQASARAARELRRKRMRSLVLRLLLWVGIPVACASVYYGVLAQEQYESTAAVMVRGEHFEQRVAALREYLGSHDLLEELEASDHFSEHFSRSRDPFTSLDPHAGSESRYRAFRDRIQIDATSGSGIVSIRMRAFSPAAAQRFLQTTVRSGGEALDRIYAGEHQGHYSVIARPSKPTEPAYPKRLSAIFGVAVISLLLFGVGSLLVSAAREHGHF